MFAVQNLGSMEKSATQVTPALRKYVEEQIIPMYDTFDRAHRREHVQYVIDEAFRLAEHYPVKADVVYTAAAYHDTGLGTGRKTHHLVSGAIIRGDRNLLQWLTPEEIELAAQAAEDHRASSDHEPRSIYGKLIAEADRQIDPMTVIRRTIQYGLKNYPELDREGHWSRMMEHLQEKYGEKGYLKLWIPESDNAARLQKLRTLIQDESGMRAVFNDIFDSEE